MSTTLAVDWLADDDLQTIAERVWSSYLDVDGARPLQPTDHDARPELTASVSVTGAWDGHVVVTSSLQAARHVAAAMLGHTHNDVTPDDVIDAMGELANVLGGNVKNLLPQPSVLSLPQVVLSSRLYFPGTRPVRRLAGIWCGEPIRISVLHFDFG
jgi:chemotaxis protein CheX